MSHELPFGRRVLALLAGVTFGLASACGSKTFESGSGGGAGKGGTENGSGGSDAATGGDAGSSGANGGTGKGGSGSGGTGRGGTDGSGTGGTGEGGTGDTGGTDVGGTGGHVSSGGAGGFGGMTAGAGGSLAGASGAGGAAAGSGGSQGGVGGCGICVVAACAPPVTVSVTAPGNIAALQGQLENRTTGATLGPLQCFPGGPAPCTWSCQFYQSQLGTADYAIVLAAPGYKEATIDFSVEVPQNCGCCGCRCTPGYIGDTELEPNSSATPDCCSTLADTANCGTCGNSCASGLACVEGECTDPP